MDTIITGSKDVKVTIPISRGLILIALDGNGKQLTQISVANKYTKRKNVILKAIERLGQELMFKFNIEE
jgi:hypothetical protein